LTERGKVRWCQTVDALVDEQRCLVCNPLTDWQSV